MRHRWCATTPTFPVVRTADPSYDVGLWCGTPQQTKSIRIPSDRLPAELDAIVQTVAGSDTYNYQQETRYYILHRVETVEKFAEASRGHRGIENSVHWSLDVTVHEDDIRIYAGHAAENLATVRKIALNALKQEKTRMLSLKNKSPARTHCPGS